MIITRRQAPVWALSALLLLLALGLVSCDGGGGSGGGSVGSYTTADYQYLYAHNAYALNGRTIRWGSNTISVASGGVDGVASAFNQWSAASGGAMQFVFGGGNITVSYKVMAGTCGLTTIWYRSSGEIINCTMKINPNQQYCTGGLDQTVLHEAAHALGFFNHDASGLMSPTGGGTITAQHQRFFGLLYSLAPGTDIRANMGVKRTGTDDKYDPQGNRVYVLTITRRASCPE